MTNQCLKQETFIFENTSGLRRHRTLVIGNFHQWDRDERITSLYNNFQSIDFGALTREYLQSHGPELILSPLVTDDFDALDLAERLVACGFKGKYRAIADDFPDTRLIRNEIRQQVPNLDFDVLQTQPARRKG